MSHEGYLRTVHDMDSVRTVALQMAAHAARNGGEPGGERARIVRHLLDYDYDDDPHVGVPETWGFSCRITKIKFFAIATYYDKYNPYQPKPIGAIPLKRELR